MAKYLVSFDDDDNWGERRYDTRGPGDSRFEEELPRQSLVRLLRWDDYHLYEERRAVGNVEVTAGGYLGHFPAT